MSKSTMRYEFESLVLDKTREMHLEGQAWPVKFDVRQRVGTNLEGTQFLDSFRFRHKLLGIMGFKRLGAVSVEDSTSFRVLFHRSVAHLEEQGLVEERLFDTSNEFTGPFRQTICMRLTDGDPPPRRRAEAPTPEAAYEIPAGAVLPIRLMETA